MTNVRQRGGSRAGARCGMGEEGERDVQGGLGIFVTFTGLHCTHTMPANA